MSLTGEMVRAASRMEAFCAGVGSEEELWRGEVEGEGGDDEGGGIASR